MDHTPTHQAHADTVVDRARPLFNDLDDIFREPDLDRPIVHYTHVASQGTQASFPSIGHPQPIHQDAHDFRTFVQQVHRVRASRLTFSRVSSKRLLTRLKLGIKLEEHRPLEGAYLLQATTGYSLEIAVHTRRSFENDG